MIGPANWIRLTAVLAGGLILAACTSPATPAKSPPSAVSEAGMARRLAPVSWSRSEVVGAGGFGQLVVGPSGTTAAWEEGSLYGPIRTRDRADDGTWGTTRVLGRGSFVAVAGNHSGLTVAVWAQLWRRDHRYRVMTSRRPAGGAWTSAQVIRVLPRGRDAIDLEVDVADDGSAAVSWLEQVEQEDPPDLQWAFIGWSTPTGVWRRPRLLVDRTWDYLATSSAISADGRIAVAYYGRSGVMYTEHPPGGTWTPERTIGSRAAANPLLMISATGDTVVVAWNTNTAFQAVRRTGATWAEPLTWARLRWDYPWDADMDAAGDVTFGWIGPQERVAVRSWPAGEDLAEPRELLPDGDPGTETYREDPQVAVGPDGHALVAVHNYGDVDRIVTFVRAPGEDWRRGRLPRPPADQGYDEVAAGTAGRFAITWERRGLRLSTLTLN